MLFDRLVGVASLHVSQKALDNECEGVLKLETVNWN